MTWSLFVTLLFTNCWTLVVKLMANRSGDDELKGIAHTYERPANARWSNPYRKINQLIIAAHAVSLISVIVLFFAGEYCMHEIYMILVLLSYLFLLDFPVRLFCDDKSTQKGKDMGENNEQQKETDPKGTKRSSRRAEKAIASSAPMAKASEIVSKETNGGRKEVKRLLHHPFQWRRSWIFYRRK